MPDLPSNNPSGVDAYVPREMAARIRAVGETKAALPTLSLLALGALAGAFIGFGALLYALVASDPGLGFAAQRFGGGLAFSLGLVLVSVAGAELFTGNNLIVIAWASGRVSGRALGRNWMLAMVGNALGALGLALLVFWAGTAGLNGGAVGRTVVAIAQGKAQLTLAEAFFRGVLCNVLVCMAVWMTMAGRSVVDKVLVIVLPVTAFVAAGFEHSIANFFVFPLALLLGAPLGWSEVAGNLLPVLAGNVLGGSGLVAGVYWMVYLRSAGPGQPLR